MELFHQSLCSVNNQLEDLLIAIPHVTFIANFICFSLLNQLEFLIYYKCLLHLHLAE